MKSNKQRRREIRQAREQRKAKKAAPAWHPSGQVAPPGSVPVNRSNLAPYNSYGDPLFVRRGWYEDRGFTCHDCGAEQTWTAAQQKWWYEDCKGQVFSTAIRCRACRLNKRIRDGRAQPATGQLAKQMKRVET
ncbi:zinc-ribbon domain containing protein [Pseudomonas sp. PDM19]|uniref:zinc-ribbon domain containing protein n=1 Tax=Pseudomonas sp. PDM19 TaxID=2769272 RepID=UPI001787558B|nr:zinc-ribbon domain containing protein [Pseudomonas sp. PDM19]MBD9631959.1 zinc-ribbon domain-containing protein [Pseudomonas sp. PDM19]